MQTFKIGDKIKLAHPRNRFDIEGVIYRGYNKKDDGVFWVMQRNVCIKSHYSAADIQEQTEFNNLPVLQNGAKVEIEGAVYDLKILGDYSDCAVFKLESESTFARLVG